MKGQTVIKINSLISELKIEVHNHKSGNSLEHDKHLKETVTNIVAESILGAIDIVNKKE